MRPWLPAEAGIILYADRFYGTPGLIRLCRDQGWDYRLWLKANLVARIGSRKTSTGELASSRGHYFEDVSLTGKRVRTNIGIIRDLGHAEPWIIAIDYQHFAGGKDFEHAL